MKMSLLPYLVLFVYAYRFGCCGYELRCPVALEWKFRSSITCPHPGPSHYYCLHDGNNDVKIELCKNKTDLLAAGKKFIFKGNPDSHDCLSSRYQPIIFWTNSSSECILGKSICTEEGQIVHSNGSTTEDKTCRCDYEQEYAFVTTPKNRVFCIPSQEDCSCYKHSCEKGYKLSSDYLCVVRNSTRLTSDSTVTGNFGESVYQRSSKGMLTLDASAKASFRLKVTDPYYESRLVVLIAIVLLILVFLMYILKLIGIRNSRTWHRSTLTKVSGKPNMKFEHGHHLTSPNNEVQLVCLIDSVLHVPVTLVEWQKDGINIFELDGYKHKRYIKTENQPYCLTIRDIKREDAGMYSCIVSSIYGRDVLVTKLTVEDQQALNISLCLMSDNGDLQISCDIPKEWNNFANKITWKKCIATKMKLIASTSFILDDTKFSLTEKYPRLTISNTDENDASKYTCYISNGVEQRVASIVVDNPKITTEKKVICASPGDHTTLHYFITSVLPVQKRFFKMNKEAEEDITGQETDKDLRYRIEETRQADSGTYVCLVKNRLGEDRKSITLIVGERPNVTVSDLSDHVYNGNTVTLSCKVTSDLTVSKVIWERDGDIIDSFGSRYDGGTADCPSLTINKVSTPDEGDYTCFVVNDVGTTESTPVKLRLTRQEPLLDKSFRQHVYTGKESTADDKSYAQVVLGKWEASLARDKSKHLIDEELRVVVIGKTGAGKSATCNMISGSEIFKSEFASRSVTKTTQHKRVKVFRKDILLIDTPGIVDPETNQEETKKEIDKCVSLGAPGIHSILFVMPIGRFTEEDKTVINTFLNYFGQEELVHHVIVVFTFGDRLQGKKTIDEYLEDSSDFIKEFLQRCNHRYVVFNNEINKCDRLNQVQNLLHLISQHKYEKVLNYYTDKLFETAEKSIKEKEDEIQRSLEASYKKRLDEMCEEFNAVKAQILQLHKEGIESDRINRLEKQMEELKARNEKEAADIKSAYDERLSHVRDEIRKNILGNPEVSPSEDQD